MRSPVMVQVISAGNLLYEQDLTYTLQQEFITGAGPNRIFNILDSGDNGIHLVEGLEVEEAVYDEAHDQLLLNIKSGPEVIVFGAGEYDWRVGEVDKAFDDFLDTFANGTHFTVAADGGRVEPPLECPEYTEDIYTVPIDEGEVLIDDYDDGDVIFSFDIGAAQASSALTQPVIANYDTNLHALELILPGDVDVNEDIADLGALVDVVDDWQAEHSVFEDQLIVQFGSNEADEAVVLILQGVQEAGDVDLIVA